MASGPVVGFSCWFQHRNDQRQQHATEHQSGAQEHEVGFLAGLQPLALGIQEARIQSGDVLSVLNRLTFVESESD